jgi:hypothetical protein
VGPEVETFLGPETATSEASAILAQKSCLYDEPSLAAFGFKSKKRNANKSKQNSSEKLQPAGYQTTQVLMRISKQ